MHGFDRIGITGPGFLGFLIMLLALLIVTTVVAGRRRWIRVAGTLIAAGVALATAAASVNAYYDYLPNLGSLWGRRAADQASWVAVRHRVAEGVGGVAHLPAHGSVVQVPIPGTVSHFRARKAELYLPPAWFRRPHPRLPVLVLLHGTPGTPEDWTRSAFADLTSDRYAVRHGGMAPILVMPDINGGFTADSECTNGTAGRIETYLTVDVPHWLRRYVHPAERPRQWAIGGFSEGGLCAVDIALRHPSEFPTFLDLGGGSHITRHGGVMSLFRGSPRRRSAAARSYDPAWLLERLPQAARLSAWFGVGTRDGATTRAVTSLYERSRSYGVHARLWLSEDGHHTFRVWKRALADAMPWLGRRLLIGLRRRPPDRTRRGDTPGEGLSACSPSCTPARSPPPTGPS